MGSAELLAAFLVATVTFAVVPGPSMAYIAAQTLGRGRRAGTLAILGVHLGGYVHVVAAAAGLVAIFHAVPALYLAIKLAGAAYLVVIGVRLLLAPVGTAGPEPAQEGRRAFVQSVTVEVLNPKTALFFLAFLPQFADPSASFALWVQLLLLGTVVNLVFSLADAGVLVLAATVGRALTTSRRGLRIARGVAGSTLVSLGVLLATRRVAP